MARPPSAKSACSTCSAIGGSPIRVATAQPPAKAAPKTSAPIRIAALTTVSTFGHRIRRGFVTVAFMRRNVVETSGRIKPELGIER